MNDTWIRVAHFLSLLNSENVKREGYVRTPEVKQIEERMAEPSMLGAQSRSFSMGQKPLKPISSREKQRRRWWKR